MATVEDIEREILRRELRQMRDRRPTRTPQRQAFGPRGELIADPQAVREPGPASVPGAVTRGATQQFITNILGIPQGAGELLATGAALPQSLVTGRPLAETRAEQRGQLPASALLSVPRVEGSALLPGGAERSRQVREQRPIATQAGELIGDVATLATGRAPLRAAGGASRAVRPAKQAQTILGRAIQTAARSSGRVGRRAAETGAELAALEAVKDGDPLEVGAIAAGIQTTGDVAARPIIKGLRKLGLTRSIVGATLLSIMARELTPGGFQIIEQTLKDRAKEIGIAAILSGGAVAATGRVPREFAGPAFAQLANATTKAGLLKLIDAFRSSPDVVGPVARAFSENPDAFSPQARRRLERAFRGEADLKKTIDELMKREDFRREFKQLTR